MLTKVDLIEIKRIVEQELDKKLDEKLEEKLKFLPSKDEFYEKMDEIMGELKAIREEQEVMSGKLSDHEDRITVLEKVCPAA